MKKLLAFLLLCGFTSWIQADDSSNHLNRLVVQQWVELTAKGELTGTVVTPVVDTLQQVGDAEIALINEKRQVKCTKAKPNGDFSFSEIAPGTYGLLVNTPTGAAVYALHVLPPSESKEGEGAKLQVSVGTLSQSMLKRMARGYIPGTRPSQPFSIETNQKDPLGADRVQSQQHQVAADKDGTLRGRVRLPSASASEVDLSTLNVVVLKGDEVVARTEAQGDGSYQFSKMEPGVYSLLVAGEEGFALTGFEFVSHPESLVRNARKPAENVRFTSTNMQGECCEPELFIEICPVPIADMVGNVCCECEASLESIVMDDGLLVEDVIVDGGFGDPSMGGYGAGGYGSGGGFGGGGGGGGGGLGGLGLAGLAAGVAAAAGGGGGGVNIVIPPASPAVP